jgi:tetratricopeptide (TPR) repeat protein
MKYIDVVENHNPVRLLLKDIVYAEVQKKLCLIHTAYGVIKTYLSIGELEKKIASTFFIRCHRSYIINMHHIKEMNKDVIFLKNGERVYVSRRLKKDVQKLYSEYVKIVKWAGVDSDSPALFNNKDLAAMQEEYNDLEKEYKKLRIRSRIDNTPENMAAYLKISNRKNEITQAIQDLQRDIVAVEANFESPRLSQTRLLFEQGEPDNTKALSDLEEMVREDDRGIKAMEAIRQDYRVKIQEYLYLAKMMKTDIKDPGRFDSINGVYKKAVELEENCNQRERVAGREYVDYLYRQKHFEEALKYARRLLHWLEIDATDEPGIAHFYHMMARCQNRLQRPGDALETAGKALAVRERLAVENPALYEKDLAKSLDTMARLYESTNQYEKAEALRGRAVEIHEQLASENPEENEPALAKSYNNLAEHYIQTHKYTQAEDFFKKSLSLYERLTEKDEAEYTPHLARCINDYAYVFFAFKSYDEAEVKYKQAIAMRERLAADNPAAYEPDLAVSLNAIYKLYDATENRIAGGAALQRALTLIERHSEHNPKVYVPHLAVISNNLAKIHEAEKRYDEAETLFKKALSLGERANNGEPIAAFVAKFSYNLALLYVKAERYTDAEKFFNDALVIYERLAKNSPDAYGPDLTKCLDGITELRRIRSI